MHRTFWCPWEQKINTRKKQSERKQKKQNALRTNERMRGCKIKKFIEKYKKTR